MIQFVYGQDAAVAGMVGRLVAGRELDYGRCKTIGVVGDGGFLGGVVFYKFDPDCGTIEISGAGTHPSWLSRRTLQRIGDFVFQECGCQMVRCEVPTDNKRVLRVLLGCGFELTYLPRMCGRDRDGVICTLTDDAWYGGRFVRFQQPMKEVA